MLFVLLAQVSLDNGVDKARSEILEPAALAVFIFCLIVGLVLVASQKRVGGIGFIVFGAMVAAAAKIPERLVNAAEGVWNWFI